MKVLRSLVILLAVPLLAAAARPQNLAPKPQASMKAVGFKAEFNTNLDDVQEKILELAESIPADKYSWRPGSDVRSVSEVFMHVAGSNYFLASFLGVDPPKTNGDLEKKYTKKADVVAELRRSFEHLRAAANGTTNLEQPVRMFGRQTSNLGVLFTISNHLHEHLGQSIAYARMNGVVPPWSR